MFQEWLFLLDLSPSLFWDQILTGYLHPSGVKVNFKKSIHPWATEEVVLGKRRQELRGTKLINKSWRSQEKWKTSQEFAYAPNTNRRKRWEWVFEARKQKLAPVNDQFVGSQAVNTQTNWSLNMVITYFNAKFIRAPIGRFNGRAALALHTCYTPKEAGDQLLAAMSG